jgi:D-alanyl-lipoteichoic acid acyltransferase DltB (MBOAT superfamily)
LFFDSAVFGVFLVIVVAVYWRLSHRHQNSFLLAASYFFYGWWDWRFMLLMATSTVADYLIAKHIGASSGRRKRRALLIASLILNFSFLGFFKYFNFFTESFTGLMSLLGLPSVPLWTLRILLPPGISFYTFQEVAYIVDVYNGKLKPADSLIDYALFISLFPHLIAGPIQRPGHLLPQVQKARSLDWEKFFDGLMLIVFGLFQKCVIADNCALVANAAFNGTLGSPSIPVVLLGTYAFAWQIYGDFAGYSNIARGCAQLMGFHFMVNFRQPYLATSLQDFWRRWHISLSSWLRDYLYISLGGNRGGERKTYRNLLITMLLGGLWHGANWTFVVWGAIHGGWLALERLLGLKGEAEAGASWLSVWLKRILVFNLVCVTWVFFRATSIHNAIVFLGGLSVWEWQPVYGSALVFLCMFSLPMFILDLATEHSGKEYLCQQQPLPARIAIALIAFMAITFVSASNINAFIYFQF